MTIGGNNTPASGATGREHNTPTYTSLTLQTDLTGTLPVNYGSTIAAADKLVFPSGGVSTTSTIDDFRRNFNQLAVDFNTEIDSIQLQVTRNDTDLGVVATKLGEHDADLIAVAKDLDQRAFRNLLINTGAGLSGGGDLESDRDLVLNIATTSERGGVVSANTATSTAHIKVETGGTMTVLDDAIALGTKTTGNYVSTIADSGSTDIIVNNSGTETALVTLGLTNTVASQTSSFLGGVSGNTVTLPKIKFDARGRITGKGTATFQSANNPTISINGTNGLTGTNSFTLNQSGAASLTISHATIASGVTDKLNSPNDITAYNDNQGGTDIVHHTFPIIKNLGVDAYGHIDNLTTTNLTYGLSNSPRGGYAAGGEYHINVPRESDFMQVERRVLAFEQDLLDKIVIDPSGNAVISKQLKVDNNILVNGGNFTVETSGNVEQFKITNSSGMANFAGDVGIGSVSTPLAPLHIHNDDNSADHTLILQEADPAIYFYDDTNADKSMQMIYNGGTVGLRFMLWDHDSGGVMDLLKVDTLGNLTAGNDITATGDISGVNATFSGTLDVASSARFNTNVDIAGTLRHIGDTNTYFEFSSGGNPQIVNDGALGIHVNASGNVGIGTSTFTTQGGAQNALQVDGGGEFSTNLKVGGQLQLTGNLQANGSIHTIGNATTDSVTLSNSFTFHKESMKITGMNDYTGNDTPAGDNYRVSIRTFEPGDLDNANKTPIHGSGTTNDYIVYEKLDGNATRADGGFAWYSSAKSPDGLSFLTEQWMRLKHNELLVNQPLVVGSSSAPKNLTVSGSANIAGNLTVDGTLDADGITVGGALSDVTSLTATGKIRTTVTTDAGSSTDANASLSTAGGLAVARSADIGTDLVVGTGLSVGGAATIGGTSSSIGGASNFKINDGRVGIGTSAPVGHFTGHGIDIVSPDTEVSELRVRGTNQGSGRIYVGQSTTHGGGIEYNGDDNPDMVTPVDDVGFFRRHAGTDALVFSYPEGSSTVTFEGDIVGKDTLTIAGSITQHGSDFKLFNTSRAGDNTHTGRALVHGTGDTLEISHANDYSGGIKFGSHSALANTGNLTIGSSTTSNSTIEAVDSGEAIITARTTGTGDATLHLQAGSSYSGNTGWTMRLDNSDADKLQWRHDNSARMTLSTDGKLGIGTTTPGHALELRGQGDIAIYHAEPEIRFYETDLTGVNNNPYRILASGGELRIKKSTADDGTVNSEIDFIRIQQDTDMLLGAQTGPHNMYPLQIITNPYNTDNTSSDSYIQTGLNRLYVGAENLFFIDGRPGANNRSMQFGITNNTTDVVSENTDNLNFLLDGDPGDNNTNVGFAVRRIDGVDRGAVAYLSRQDGSSLILNTNEAGNVVDYNVAGQLKSQIHVGGTQQFGIYARTGDSTTLRSKWYIHEDGRIINNNETVIIDENTTQAGGRDDDPSAVLHLRSRSSDHIRFENISASHMGTIDVDATNGMYIEVNQSTGKIIRLRPDNTDRLVVTDTQTRVIGQLDVEKTTETTSITTGAMIVAGGVGIAKSLRVGGDFLVNGNTTLGNATTDTTTIKGALKAANDNFDVNTSGDITDVGHITSSGKIRTTNTADSGSASSTTSSINTAGGLSVTLSADIGTDLTVGDDLAVVDDATIGGKLSLSAEGIEFNDGSTLTSSATTRRGIAAKLSENYSGKSATAGAFDASAFISWDGSIYSNGESREETNNLSANSNRGFVSEFLPDGELAAKVYQQKNSWWAISTTGKAYFKGNTRDGGSNLEITVHDGNNGLDISSTGFVGEGNSTSETEHNFSTWRRWGTFNPDVTFEKFINSGESDVQNTYALDTNGHLWGWGDGDRGQLADGIAYSGKWSGHSGYYGKHHNSKWHSMPTLYFDKTLIAGETNPREKDMSFWNDPHAWSGSSHGTATGWGTHTYGTDSTPSASPAVRTDSRNQSGIFMANFRTDLAYPSFNITPQFTTYSDFPNMRKHVPQVMTPIANAAGELVHGGDIATQFHTTFTDALMYGSSDYEGVLGLGANGKCYQCGYGGRGQHGSSATEHRHDNANWNIIRTSSAAHLQNITKIYTQGDDHDTTLYAIDTSGNLWGWGYNVEGQLGLGTTTNKSYATKIWDASQRGVGVKEVHTNAMNADNETGVLLLTNETIPQLWYTGDNTYYGPGLGTTPGSETSTSNEVYEWTRVTWGPGNTTNFKIIKIYYGGGRTQTDCFCITQSLVDNGGYGENPQISKAGDYQLHAYGHNTKNATGIFGRRSSGTDDYGTYIKRFEMLTLPNEVVSQIDQINTEYQEAENRTLMHLSNGRILFCGYAHYGILGHNESAYMVYTPQYLDFVDRPA